MVGVGVLSLWGSVGCVGGGGGGGKELLIPFVSLYVDEVDVSNGIIRVNWEKDY